MNKQEQNKNWSLLSEESKYYYQTEYKNRLEDSKREVKDPEGGGDLTVLTSQYIAEDLEKIFGEHNLKPSLTYKDVARELFKDSALQADFYKSEYAFDTYPLNCTSEKQAEKLMAINKLLNVAKFLNKNEDGTDWKPTKQDGLWTVGMDREDGQIKPIETGMYDYTTEIVYFRSKEIAQQAIGILGENVVRSVLSIKF